LAMFVYDVMYLAVKSQARAFLIWQRNLLLCFKKSEVSPLPPSTSKDEYMTNAFSKSFKPMEILT